MSSARRESMDDFQLENRRLSFNTTPAQTNLRIDHGNRDGLATSQSKVHLNIGNRSTHSMREESNGTPLEYRLKMNDLEILKQSFDKYENENNEPLNLNKSEFVNFILKSLNRGNYVEYEELFDNIDVTQTGFVNWDKFASYLLNMLYESDDRLKAFSVPNWKPIKNIYNIHRDSIRRIEYVKNTNRYLTISKEGSCCMFDKGSNLISQNKITSESCKTKDLWITDFILFQNVNKVALGFTTKEIGIYEMTSKLDFNCQYRITHLNSIPLCIDYWFDPTNPNDSILVWGDTLGEVHIIFFNSATIALFERPSNNNVQSKSTSNTNDTCLEINIHSLNENFKNASYLNYKAHNGWVRQVKWAKQLECALSCATTSKQSVCLGWYIKKNSHIKATYLNIINGGVNAFDYDPKSNLIATGNQNTVVNLFNPYVNEPNGILKGHTRLIIAVKFMCARSQLISFSADKVLRIWNVPLQICIQRVTNVFPKGPEVDISCCFDETSNRFYIAFKYTLLMMEIKPEVTNRIQTHDKAVVSAKFNKNSNQVLTLSQDGNIYMWLIESGQKVKSFNELHGPGSELTCMEFDETNTRIYTAGTDGAIKIWDFNGHCYNTLEANESQGCEISQILSLKRRLIAVGWQKSISTFRENMFRDHKVPATSWKGREEHEDDILCAAIMKIPPMFLATGSFDGDIVLWNSVTELCSKHITARKRIIKTKEQTSLSLRAERKSSRIQKSAKSTSFNLSEADKFLQKNDFSCAIICLRFLNTRIFGRDAILVSCGGNAWVRFWDISNGKLVSEFQAHVDVSSVIMEIDSADKYLATGDINGLVKIWDISDYCLDIDESDPVSNAKPKLVSSILSHDDVINSIDFCLKNDKQYVIIASSDCSVSLNDINGNQIGIFGQESHWKMDSSLSVRHHNHHHHHHKSNYESQTNLKLPEIKKIDLDDSNLNKETIPNEKESSEESDIDEETKNTEIIIDETKKINEYSGLLPKINTRLSIEPTFQFDVDAFIKDTSLRYNPWSKTILGKSYQESRIKKRDRKQPGIINSHEYEIWDKTGQAPGGLYGSLEIVELDPLTNEPKKPDFMINPHRYFRERNAPTLLELKTPPKGIAETLRNAFDEKSLFPKYILDYETKMRNEHKNILGKLVKESESSKRD